MIQLRRLKSNFYLCCSNRKTKGEHPLKGVEPWSKAFIPFQLPAEIRSSGKSQHLWSKTYNGSIEDVVSMQNQIVREVAGEVETIINPESGFS